MTMLEESPCKKWLGFPADMERKYFYEVLFVFIPWIERVRPEE